MNSKKNKLDRLMQAMALIENQKEALCFLSDLCTPAELEAMADRWEVIPFLQEGIPYRTIHERTGVSAATITRVARSLKRGTGGYQLIAERLTSD